MTPRWDTLRSDLYLGLYPWAWMEFETAEPPGPFPFLGGVAPAVVASLHEVHQRLSGAIDMVISEVFAGRASPHDPTLRTRLENAYAEVVQSRPHLREHIHCGRRPDGTFHWEYPLDPKQSLTVQYAGLRIFNAAARQLAPLRFEPEMAPAVGKLIGCLDGTRTVAEIQAEIQRIEVCFGQKSRQCLSGLLDLLSSLDCLSVTPRSSIRARWLASTQDRDVVHLGHAALMYRHHASFLLFDPWLIPWFAEAPVPSLWTTVLPRPAAIFLTHEHDDHVDPRTLLAFPKETPVIVPSRAHQRGLFYDYQALLHGLGFTQVIELAHGETWTFDGGGVTAVPFYGECSCELHMPRNCYLITDRGRNVLIHVDSGPTNTGKNMVQDGVIDALVRRYGAIDMIYAQPGQLLELRALAAYACLSPPGRWLDVGENCCVTSEYLARLAASAGSRLLVAYANGGADWLPDHPVFVFSRRNQALRELVTAQWWPMEELHQKLASLGSRCHCSQARDIARLRSDRDVEILPAAAPSPDLLYQLDHRDLRS